MKSENPKRDLKKSLKSNQNKSKKDSTSLLFVDMLKQKALSLTPKMKQYWQKNKTSVSFFILLTIILGAFGGFFYYKQLENAGANQSVISGYGCGQYNQSFYNRDCNVYITDADLSTLVFTCGSNLVVNTTTTCTGQLPAGKTLDPSNPLRISIGDANLSNNCTLENNNIVCTNVSTGSTAGQSIPVKAKLGNGELVNTASTVNVAKIQPILDTVRTGGGSILLLGLLFIGVLGIMFFVSKNRNKSVNNIKIK